MRITTTTTPVPLTYDDTTRSPDEKELSAGASEYQYRAILAAGWMCDQAPGCGYKNRGEPWPCRYPVGAKNEEKYWITGDLDYGHPPDGEESFTMFVAIWLAFVASFWREMRAWARWKGRQ